MHFLIKPVIDDHRFYLLQEKGFIRETITTPLLHLRLRINLQNRLPGIYNIP